MKSDDVVRTVRWRIRVLTVARIVAALPCAAVVLRTIGDPLGAWAALEARGADAWIGAALVVAFLATLALALWLGRCPVCKDRIRLLSGRYACCPRCAAPLRPERRRQPDRAVEPAGPAFTKALARSLSRRAPVLVVVALLSLAGAVTLGLALGEYSVVAGPYFAVLALAPLALGSLAAARRVVVRCPACRGRSLDRNPRWCPNCATDLRDRRRSVRMPAPFRRATAAAFASSVVLLGTVVANLNLGPAHFYRMLALTQDGHPLFFAVAANDLVGTRALVTAGEDVNETTPYGTALGMAVRARRRVLVDFLLDHGADPVAGLHDAVFVGDHDLLQRLVASGSDVDHPWRRVPPLAYAAHLGRLPAVETLLAAGADPNGPGCELAPLANAARAGHVAVVSALLAAGADPTGGSECRDTPAMQARRNGHAEVARLLAAAAAETH